MVVTLSLNPLEDAAQIHGGELYKFALLDGQKGCSDDCCVSCMTLLRGRKTPLGRVGYT